MIRTVAQIETKLASTLLFALLLCVSASAQVPQKPEQLAQVSSDAWLNGVDSGKYAESLGRSGAIVQGRRDQRAMAQRSG